jgi:hypothetical protein
VSTGVTAADRRRDRIALAIFAAGALLFLYAYAGMRSLETGHLVSVVPHQQEMRFDRYWVISLVGKGVAAIGALAMGWSYMRYRMRPEEPR